MKSTTPPEEKKGTSGLLALAALGVVFGDIGTSPLYALHDCFTHGLSPTPDHVLGVLSLIFWGLMLIVCFKYIFIVMNASNKGEGGILALTTLASGGARKLARRTTFIALLGFCGASLFFGDSVITPAISVLSAVEGLKVAAPRLSEFVLPISVLILVALFWFQKRGTQKVGSYFGPIMIVWFAVIAILGLKQIFHHPNVLAAIDPMYGLALLTDHSVLVFTILGSVLLAFTGVEALYADMGHFGRSPIRFSWFAIVFPSLILNYFGQGALLLETPEASLNPFYLLVPQSYTFPMVLLASVAAVIASQAVISGTFSLTQQAVQLGYLPRMDIRHTSAFAIGQIYIPKVNWILCGVVILLIMIFKTSTALADAYGFAVMGTMVTTTILVITVAQHIWSWKRWMLAAVFIPLSVIDFMFFATSITKIPDGGWLPLFIGSVMLLLFMTWHQGREVVLAHRREKSNQLATFVEALKTEEYPSVQGTAIYLATLRNAAPSTLLNNLRHNKVLHERIIILHIHNEEEPRVGDEERLAVKKLPHNFWQVTLHYGFMERPNVMEDLQTYLLADCPIEKDDTSFFVGHDVYIMTDHQIKPFWRERLFMAMASNATSMFQYLNIPPERIVEFGIQVEV